MESFHDRTAESGKRFRIRVCLKRFFQDERALAYVSVRGAARVRWLQRRLRALFALPPHFALLCAGHLLPPDEPLALLHPDDLVDVLPTRVDHDENWNGVAECPDVDSSACNSFPESDRGPGGRCDPVDRCDVVEYEPDAMSDFDMTPSSPGAPREDDERHDLDERKRRALALLEQHCHPRQSDERTEPRARRRRVRRRRRQPSAAPLSAAPSPAQTASPRSPSVGSEDAVLRNLVQIPRTPRIVRPLLQK